VLDKQWRRPQNAAAFIPTLSSIRRCASLLHARLSAKKDRFLQTGTVGGRATLEISE